MPRKLRRISGKELLKLLLKEGFAEVRSKGDHVRLSKRAEDTTYHVTIPLHDELDRGTQKSIVRSLERCFSKEKISELFYTR